MDAALKDTQSAFRPLSRHRPGLRTFSVSGHRAVVYVSIGSTGDVLVSMRCHPKVQTRLTRKLAEAETALSVGWPELRRVCDEAGQVVRIEQRVRLEPPDAGGTEATCREVVSLMDRLYALQSLTRLVRPPPRRESSHTSASAARSKKQQRQSRSERSAS